MKKRIKKFLPLLFFLASFFLLQADSNALEAKYPLAIAFIQKAIQAAGLMPGVLKVVAGTGWHCKLDAENPWYVLSIPEAGRFSLKNLEDTLTKNDDVSPYQFVVAHEVNHLMCNHAHKRAIIQIIKDIGVTAAALATHALIYCKSDKLNSAQHFALHTIAAAIEYCALTKNPCVYEYFRSLEQEADDCVRNDIRVLRGGVVFLEAHKNQEAPSSWLNYIKKLLSKHPDISARVAKLQDRIKILEQN